MIIIFGGNILRWKYFENDPLRIDRMWTKIHE